MATFVFSADELKPTKVDPEFADQAAALVAAGHSVCTFDSDEGRVRRKPNDAIAGPAILRGWMLSSSGYETYVAALTQSGLEPLTNHEQYLSSHHLPNWYPALEGLTAETVFLSSDADLEAELKALGWDAFFLKDWVKSLKTSVGSVVRDPSQAPVVAREMEKFRGTIEGGICVRRYEELVPATERRYFVLDGQCHAPQGHDVPRLVYEVAERLTASRFFSVDVAETSGGVSRVVEVGDGQVSDLVGWDLESFVGIFAST